MNAPELTSAMRLSKQQAKRLRHYFERGSRASVHEFDGIDLDLIGFKLIEATQHKHISGSRIELTAFGVEVLHQHRQADIAVRNVHHDLGGRLGEHLRKQGRITWENVEFKNMVMNRELNYERWQFVRPDVFSILPSLNLKGANPCIHEVKVSRADFLSDLAKPEKRAAYALMAEAVYYVAPEGVINSTDMPQGFGLLVERAEGEFVLAKRPRKHKIELQPHHYLNMIVKPGNYPDNYGL
jgi:hypothetical protein